MNPLFVTWCISNNVGDALSYWLVNKITGYNPIYVKNDEYCEKYMLVGSILNWADSNTIVWGAGLAEKESNINKEVDIRAVRGPLSRDVALNCGASCPEVYGDPALLLPKFYDCPVEKKYKLGIIPHYVDQFIVFNSELINRPEVHMINVFDSVEKFIDEVRSCNFIMSSSLHGLIIAQAYEIPVLHFEASNQLGGDGMKFHDYFLSTGQKYNKVCKWYNIHHINTNAICNKIPLTHLRIDLDKLWNSCPLGDK
jgi:pyruvyltransferase